jgi:hypothetical protein
LAFLVLIRIVYLLVRQLLSLADQSRIQRRDRAGGVIHEYRLVA